MIAACAAGRVRFQPLLWMALLALWILPGCTQDRPSRHEGRLSSQSTTTAPVTQSGATRPSQASPATQASTLPPASQPGVIYDTTLPKAVPPRDFLERWAMQRGPDLEFVDKLMDPRTPLLPFDRTPPAAMPADAAMAPGVSLLNEEDPFPESVPLNRTEVTVRVGIARSTYRTRTTQEVLAAAQPFIDIVQRDVNMHAETFTYEDPKQLYFDLVDGKIQMGISQVFDALLIRSWVASSPDNRVILLSWAQPANPHTTPLDADVPGPPGTGIVLVVAQDAPYKTFADLKGARLALPASYVNAPGAFLTRQLLDAGQSLDAPFFGSVILRQYSKDAAIDILKFNADVACVDEGTYGALARFYGLDKQLRVLAVSPHYNIDVLFTSTNNVATHETQIELAQRMLLTLGRDPEGQEVLFFFDIASWNTYHEGDLSVATDHFEDFLQFLQHTPVDLKSLLDPHAPVNRKTYTRYGDE